MTKAIVIRTTGDPEIAGAIVEGMDRQEPEEAYEQIVSATNKAKEAWNRRANDG